MRFALVAMIAACGGARAPAPAPTPAAAPPPAIAGFVRVAELELGQFATTPQQVVVVDGGHRAVLAYQDLLTFVDLDKPALLGPPVSLSSQQVPSGLRPPFSPWRHRSVGSSLWAWDEDRAALTGAVRIFSGKRDTVELAAWEPAGEAAPRTLRDGDRRTELLALAPDGRTLLIRASTEGVLGDTLELFDLATARRAGVPMRTGNVDSAAFSPDGTRVALAMSDGALVLLTPRTAVSQTLAARGEPFRRAAFHPTRPLLLVSEGLRVRAWDLAADPPTSLAYDLGPTFAFTPDGRHLAAARHDSVELYDVATMSRIGEPHVPSVPRGRAIHLAFSPDGRRLVAVWEQRAISVLDLAAVEDPTPPSWFSRIRPLALPAPEEAPPFGRDGEVTGRVVAGGAPVAGAVVRLTPSQREWPDARALPALEARTDDGGRYTLAGVARIAWTLSAELPGHVASERDVGLRGERTADVDVAMVRALSIAGTVVGPRGKVAGTRVRVSAARFGRGSSSATATVGRDGRFTVDGLASDTPHGVWAHGPEGRAGFATVTGRGPIEKVTVKLRPHGSPDVIRVRAVSPTGTPLAGVALFILAIPFVHHDVTGEDGTYTFALPPTATRVAIKAAYEGHLDVFDRTFERPFPEDVGIVVTPAP